MAWGVWAQTLLDAVSQLLLNPFLYIAILVIVLQTRRQISLERKLFHVRLHGIWNEAWRSVLWGLAAGVPASLLMMLLGARVSFGASLLIGGVALLLMLVRVRYLCFAYAVGILGLLKALLGWVPSLGEASAVRWLAETINSLDVPALLAIVAILHLAEALLVRRQGGRMASPLFLEGKRGKIVGGYHLQGFWPVPLLLLVPSGPLELPWTPLFASDAASAGWSFAALPVVLGFTELTSGWLPKEKLRRTSRRLTGYAAAILAAALLTHYVPVLLLPASLLAIALHEALIWWSRREEERAVPYFVHDTGGLKVLAVVPGGPASELGLQAGEVIRKVNGAPVRTKDELHQAMRVNPAFCKMEVINLEGHSKFVSRAMFAGEHHQLGIVLCPDDHADVYVAVRSKLSGVASLLARKWNGLSEGRSE